MLSAHFMWSRRDGGRKGGGKKRKNVNYGAPARTKKKRKQGFLVATPSKRPLAGKGKKKKGILIRLEERFFTGLKRGKGEEKKKEERKHT